MRKALLMLVLVALASSQMEAKFEGLKSKIGGLKSTIGEKVHVPQKLKDLKSKLTDKLQNLTKAQLVESIKAISTLRNLGIFAAVTAAAATVPVAAASSVLLPSGAIGLGVLANEWRKQGFGVAVINGIEFPLKYEQTAKAETFPFGIGEGKRITKDVYIYNLLSQNKKPTNIKLAIAKEGLNLTIYIDNELLQNNKIEMISIDLDNGIKKPYLKFPISNDNFQKYLAKYATKKIEEIKNQLDDIQSHFEKQSETDSENLKKNHPVLFGYLKHPSAPEKEKGIEENLLDFKKSLESKNLPNDLKTALVAEEYDLGKEEEGIDLPPEEGAPPAY